MGLTRSLPLAVLTPTLEIDRDIHLRRGTLSPSQLGLAPVRTAGRSLGRDPSPLPTGEGATYKFLAFASLSRIPRSRMAVLYLELQTRALKAPLIYES